MEAGEGEGRKKSRDGEGRDSEPRAPEEVRLSFRLRPVVIRGQRAEGRGHFTRGDLRVRVVLGDQRRNFFWVETS
jgi:hypothetical protein